MTATEDALVTVNGIAITQAQINQELVNHTGKNPLDNRRAAVQRLVARELLLQEAVKWGLCDCHSVISKPEVVIEKLLATQIKVTPPDEASCKRYFDEKRDNFATASLCEASHIFFSAPLGDVQARQKARNKANAALAEIKKNPNCFDEIARAESDCSSAASGGSLGRVARGQTVPAFEAALMAMSKGDISEQPVETEVGFHIIRLDDHVEGEGLPFEMLKDWISQYLGEQSWQKAVSGYVKGLADKAEIKGCDFDEQGMIAGEYFTY